MQTHPTDAELPAATSWFFLWLTAILGILVGGAR